MNPRGNGTQQTMGETKQIDQWRQNCGEISTALMVEEKDRRGTEELDHRGKVFIRMPVLPQGVYMGLR